MAGKHTERLTEANNARIPIHLSSHTTGDDVVRRADVAAALSQATHD